MKKLLSLGLCFFVLGCATLDQADFYGVRVTQNVDDKAFQIYDFEGQNVVHSTGGSINGDVEAWGEIKSGHIVIKFKNKMANTLRSDYFFDKFYLFAKSGTVYSMKKQEPVAYRYNVPEDIRAGQWATFVLDAPANIQAEDVEKIVGEIGLLSGARIVLKRLPQAMLE